MSMVVFRSHNSKAEPSFLIAGANGKLGFGRFSPSAEGGTVHEVGDLGEGIMAALDPGPGGFVEIRHMDDISPTMSRIAVKFSWSSATFRAIAERRGKRTDAFMLVVRIDQEANTIDIDPSWDIDARRWRGAGEAGITFHCTGGATVTMSAPWSQRPLTAAAVPSRSLSPRGRRKASRQKSPDLVVSMPCNLFEQATLS